MVIAPDDPPLPRGRLRLRKLVRVTGLTLAWLVVAALSLWALAALYIDTREPKLGLLMSVLYAIVLLTLLYRSRFRIWGIVTILGSFCCILIWWLSLKPTNTAGWQPNVDRTAWIERNGDNLLIHNFRNCQYRTETAYAHCWTERALRLSELRGVDLFFDTWGVPYIGHPIVSFSFADHQHVAFSIEARYKTGQSYSAVLGFFRQYELVFVTADERDVVRLRTNFGKGEDVFLYRTTLDPEASRSVFLAYVHYLNQLRDHPQWYNAATRNCTTTLERDVSSRVRNPQPWDYRFLVNGTLDELLFDRGRLVTDGLAYRDLKRSAYIHPAAKAADSDPAFSSAIRVNRPGFRTLE